jgi:CRP/FNR family transcriptional regulator, cyclic AMP receptor protein
MRFRSHQDWHRASAEVIAVPWLAAESIGYLGGVAQVCHVLEIDPDLAAGLDDRRLQRARQECIAAELVVDEGVWWPEESDGEAARGGIGLLIVDGLLIRRVGAEGRYGAELLGPGDLLRPWQHDGEDTLPFDTSFRVIERLHLAVLDPKAVARMGPYPEVVGALVGRAMQRARHFAVSMAIAHYPRIDRRLLLLLWHLADRWGRVTPEGIRIPLRLTHTLLADLVAARRPSVTTALIQLEHEGHLARDDHTIVLHGEPPTDFPELAGATHGER